MASEFLRKKAQEQKNATSKNSSSTTKYTSSTLSSKASAQREKLVKEFGDPYVSSKKRIKKEEEDIAPVYKGSGIDLLDELGTWMYGGLERDNSGSPYATYTFDASKREAMLASLKERGSWFKTPEAFEDGYDFGDISLTILGTGTNIAQSVGTGLASMPEKIIDATKQLGTWMYGGLKKDPNAEVGSPYAFYVMDVEAREKEKEETKAFVEKDLYDAEAVAQQLILSPYGIDARANSVLGNKAEGLAQSAGELVGAKMVDMLAPGLGSAAMGMSAFGGELENAYSQGATFDEATASAAITAGAEVISEQMFGAIKFGGKALDDGIMDAIARNVPDAVLRSLAKFGVDAAGEGFEEIVSEIGNKLASTLYKEENWKEILLSPEALNDYIESFIGGMVLGGGMGAVNIAKSNANGIDAVTGLTKNEQAVVDAIYEARLAENDGKKKADIYDDIMQQLERGELSLEEIEKVYGGTSYQEYKDLKAEEAKYNRLYNTESGKLTEAEKDALAELKAKNAATPYKQALADAWSKFSKDYEGFAKDSKLMETYNERLRRGQSFEADLNQYTGKARDVVKSAIDSGVFNNTKRSKEFVNLVAKIAADKDMDFDFANEAKVRERLKETGFALDNVRVNGYVEGGKITINMDSKKSLNSIVGHEITHVLEGSDLYTELQNTLMEYAKSRGEYDARYKSIAALYQGKKADIDAELTADLIGDYLFSDTEFIRQLSVQNRNIFEKVYDEIKYLCKVATAGSKEARQLEKVKKDFAEIYRSTKADTSAKSAEAPQTTRASNESYGVIENLLSKDRVNNTLANEIIQSEELSQAFTDITGVELEGTTEQKRQIIRNTVREYHMTEAENEALAMDAAEQAYAEDAQAKAEQAVRDSGYRSYIRGMFLKGATVADAYEILGNPELKAEWESITGKTLPDNAKSAVKMITQTKRNPQNIDLPKLSLDESQELAENNVEIMSGGSAVKFSLSTWTPEAKASVRDNLIKAGYEATQVDKWIEDTNGVAAAIAADKDRLDFKAADNHTMLKNNQEYIKTLDASTLCAKRLVYQGTFDAIQFRLPDTVLSSDDLIELLNMMKERGIETPCGVCYVESRRRHLGKFAQDWLNGYKGEYKPRLADVTTSKGLEALRHSHPQTYKDFVAAMNKKGSSNPKVVQLRTEYRNDIMSLTPAQIRKILAIGGLRVQSFSDFETPHLLDMMQAVMDMAAKQLTSQAYTKVPNFAWVFGNTGMKINLSLIAEGNGFDADGNLAFSSTEGMDIEEATKLRNAYSQNVGTIIVGANDKHILACMADDRIDFIIPFHRSGWGQRELDAMGMSGYQDYSYGQNEHDLQTGEKVSNLYPPDYWDYSLSGKENAERYLNLCAQTGREPKFSQFLVNNGDGSYSLQPDGSTDGYWKTLIDFKMYDNDGNGAPQQKIQPNFNMDEAYRVLNEYEGGANTLPVANDVVEEFVAKKQGTQLSLSPVDEDIAPIGDYNVYGEDVMLKSLVAPKGENIAPTSEDVAPIKATTPVVEREEKKAPTETKAAEKPPTRRGELHARIMDTIKNAFSNRGYDFDEILKKAKNLSTLATVDNTPQRVIEKTFGYKEGQILNNLTVDQVAQNESKGIKWLNGFTDRKNGIIAKISKQYNIKPGSKESAAAQMYAEGFYVNDKNELIAYGDAELAKDFPDAKVQENIKGLAGDSRIRQIYDETLKAINESRIRNAYPEIPRLDNYFLHFRAMEDTFSRLGLPFNPNDIRAKDLPTDLNGVTADLKPGQPFFASSMHRTGKRTSYDLLGGLEMYLTSAKNQIFHIDDIQTLRALRNYIASTYGRAEGLEDLDELSSEAARERIDQVFGSHLSNFAKFLNEEANIIAGKTALIDRGLEGVIGRRGMTFLKTVNSQVGSNMVGLNVSSSLTNFLPIVQAFAKTNKGDFVKAFAQTVANKFRTINGEGDGFAENSPVVIRRKGAERFYRTPWQKAADIGYVLMSAVDDISTEIIARTKYNEYTRKGMDSQQAHIETDKWVSRLMGDRSLGQMPQVYNSKTLGLITKFQLEVRNQLDSMFYDTIQEAKVSSENIENELARNAATAAKITSTFVQLAFAQHLFGKAFEAVAGYNPAFDIIEVLMVALGWDDDEENEDTVLDNIEQGFLALLEDMPYASTFLGGGRIPIASALPIKELVTGVDEYGNDKSRWETLAEVAPYYALPTGYGQIKKTVKGLSMFSDDHPIAGSYTKNGNLRYSVEDTIGNRIKAGIFGQYASKNANIYFDESRRTLTPDQTSILAELDIPISEYWEYQDSLDEFNDVKDAMKKVADATNATAESIVQYKYLSSISSEITDLYEQQKAIAKFDTPNKQEAIKDNQERINELLKAARSGVDAVSVDGYYAEVGGKRFRYNPESKNWSEIKATNSDGTDNGTYVKEREVTTALGISYAEYWSKKEEYDYAYEHPENYAFSKAVGGYEAYKGYSDALYDIKADKDANGNSIRNSRKNKVIDYINNLDTDEMTKLILYKSEYTSYDDHNVDIINYLNSRDDLSYQDIESILKELGFKVDKSGRITW